MQIETRALEGPSLRLTPVSRECLPELTEAMLSAPHIWEHIPYAMQTPADIRAVVEHWCKRHERGDALSCATRLRESGRIVGGSSIVLIDPQLPTVEIGFTWILPAWQRTHVNTEAKLVQLTHCFDVLGCGRVELKTDIRNLRSRAAIARIGGTQEGILRAHRRRPDGSLRDSVLFSILASEWPAVRERLTSKLVR
ncbi:MAG TPA: GNAT family protein [Polyangiales bacterium]|nr:GNAT family protein [Polyangiales bacterium]